MTWFALPFLMLVSPAQDQIIIADQRIVYDEPQPQPVATPALEAPDPETAADQTPIIVERDRDEEPDRVILGSRIPRGSIYTNGNIATSTGIAGLTPDSGLNPFRGTARTSKRITTTCVSDDEAISERAACLLVEAQSALAEDDLVAAGDIYRFLVGSAEFSASERLAGGTGLYALARLTDDSLLREEALIRMIDADVLPAERQASARRSLAQMALDRGENRLAIERLEQHVALSPDDANSFANLAILRRSEGLEGAETAMASAISIKERAGEPVPDGWTDFVRLAPAIEAEAQ
jgi:hypothetical protein